MTSCVRVIGGKYRGKKIEFPEMPGLRPTPDRVRETLFNWLMHDIRHATCLDAFAGSGALGFEAYSRGAKRVVFVESALRVCAYLTKQLQAFQSEDLTLMKQDALDYLSKAPESFDIIFLDPPFKTNLLQASIERIEASNILSPQGILYIESSEVITMNPSIWKTEKLKKAGQVVYGLFKKN